MFCEQNRYHALRTASQQRSLVHFQVEHMLTLSIEIFFHQKQRIVSFIGRDSLVKSIEKNQLKCTTTAQAQFSTFFVHFMHFICSSWRQFSFHYDKNSVDIFSFLNLNFQVKNNFKKSNFCFT